MYIKSIALGGIDPVDRIPMRTPEPPNSNPTTIRLDEQDRRLLARLAKHERVPRSEIVRRAIRRMADEAGLSAHGKRSSSQAASA